MFACFQEAGTIPFLNDGMNLILTYVHVLLYTECSSIDVQLLAPYDVNITAGDIMERPATVEYEDDLLLTCTASGGLNNPLLWFKDDDFLDNRMRLLKIFVVILRV